MSQNDQVLGLALGLDDKDYFREDGTYDRKSYERDKQVAIQNAKEEFLDMTESSQHLKLKGILGQL